MPSESLTEPTRYNTTALAPLLGKLDVGDIVERELLTDDETRGVTSTVPCCGRRIVLYRWPKEDLPAICCRCHAGYTVGVKEEMTGYDDKPYRTALFIVTDLDVAVAVHRAK